MKKYLLLLFSLLLITGCASKTQKYEDTMKEYATDYYTTYMVGTNANVAEVSIDMLSNVNSLGLDKSYDLSSLSKCNGSSYVDMTIDADTKTITNYEFHMDCK